MCTYHFGMKRLVYALSCDANTGGFAGIIDHPYAPQPITTKKDRKRKLKWPHMFLKLQLHALNKSDIIITIQRIYLFLTDAKPPSEVLVQQYALAGL
jgi:hypothetical protein